MLRAEGIELRRRARDCAARKMRAASSRQHESGGGTIFSGGGRLVARCDEAGGKKTFEIARAARRRGFTPAATAGRHPGKLGQQPLGRSGQ